MVTEFLAAWNRWRGGGALEQTGFNVPAAPVAGGRWSQLGMDRIALGDSGWEIQFIAIPGNPPYLLIDPESRALGGGAHLEALKALGEGMHAERMQFRCNRG
jgi:hypothetical protein